MENCEQAISLGKLWLGNVTRLFYNSIFYVTSHKVWLFEKFIFEPEAF